jgi:hypothetical protein
MGPVGPDPGDEVEMRAGVPANTAASIRAMKADTSAILSG